VLRNGCRSQIGSEITAQWRRGPAFIGAFPHDRAHAIIPMLQELSRVFPGLQLKLLRGSRNEVADYLKSGAADMAIAGHSGSFGTS